MYVRSNQAGAEPLIYWSPAASESCVSSFNSLDEFRGRFSGYETTGRQINRTPRSVFKSPELDRYELLPEIPAARGARELPPDVRKTLGWNEKESRTVGAYPVHR
jgi:hypothetical protein